MGLSAPNARQIRDTADWLIPSRARPTRPRLIQQALEPVGHKPRPPLNGASDMDIELVGDRGVARPVGGSQHNPRPRIANALALFGRRDHATNWACSSFGQRHRRSERTRHPPSLKHYR